MRVLIFNWKDLAHPEAGGAEVFTEQVARGLVARGHDVTLFASAVAGRPGRENVHGVNVVRRGGRIGVYREARRFWGAQQRGAFDVVIDEINTRPFLTPRFVPPTPIVALIHQLAREIWSFETPFPVSVLGRHVLEPWWLRAYRRVPAMTVSQSSADSLAQYHGWEDVVVLREGLAPHAVPDVPKEQDPTIVFLGRLVAMKRPEHALRAYDRVARRLPSARLWVIGAGPLASQLRALASPGVMLLGRLGREELRDRLARAHVLVATSIREGWGLNVSEAAACGTPAIGYRVPGLVDSVAASGGQLVEPTPEALGDALLDLFSHRLTLSPTVSTVPWGEVALSVEDRLERAIGASGLR